MKSARLQVDPGPWYTAGEPAEEETAGWSFPFTDSGETAIVGFGLRRPKFQTQRTQNAGVPTVL